MKRFLLLALAGSAVVFFSCSSDQPVFDDVRTMIIYDFEDMQKLPVMRMAVYVRLNSKSQKDGTLSLSLPSAGYTWNIGKPRQVVDTEEGCVWIGTSNIVPASGTEFEAGEYRLLYTDKASMKTETFFSVHKFEPVNKVDLALYTSERLAIFDAEGFLLGYDTETEKEQIGCLEIPEKYPGAFFSRTVLLSTDGLSLVAKPPVFFSEVQSLFTEGGIP